MLSLEAIGQFVTASEEIQFEAEDRKQLYGWVERVLVGQQYAQLGKAARGLVRLYIEKMSGLSRAQLTRVAGSTPRISEAYLEPLLEQMMRQFSFRILGFHTDNGSEFINKTVAQLLEKLRVEQTKSRPRQSGDNDLVETKNGAVIRKHIGYGVRSSNLAHFAHLNWPTCTSPDVKIRGWTGGEKWNYLR